MRLEMDSFLSAKCRPHLIHADLSVYVYPLYHIYLLTLILLLFFHFRLVIL